MTTTTAANTGDPPLGHPGFVREEEEEEDAVGEERYDSDDDDDVDRYVFLARQPATPVEAEASDDDDAIPRGEGGGGGERLLREIVADAPPAAKKARLDLAAPRGASAEESGSEGSVHSPGRFRGVLDQGKKNKKRRRCGGEKQAKGAARDKRSIGAGREAGEWSEHRDVTAGKKTPVPAAGAQRRFVCSICGKYFGSYQALGGHVHLGHTKKAKNFIAAGSRGDVTRNEKVAIADGAGHGKDKAAVAASSEDSDSDGKKTLRAAACRQDVDSSSGDSNSDDGMFIGAADHGDHRGEGNVEGQKVATSHDDTDSTERKFSVGRCHKLTAGAIGNANSTVRKMQYRCEVCGKECLSGQALGGHMRKHWKRSPHNGGKELRSPEVADGAGHGQGKTPVAASPGEPDGDGKKILSEEVFTGAADHGDHPGDRSVEEKVTVATSQNDADSYGKSNGTERKAFVERCHELAAGAIVNANSIVRKRKMQYMCEVCGKECLSGQALGGHMRKHRKLSPHDGGKEGRSPEVAGGAGHGQEKTAVAESHRESDGDGKKTLSAAACHQDVDSSSGDSNSNEEGMFIGKAKHGDADGDRDGTERKVAVGRCQELATGAIGNANSAVRKTQYRCELCGKEYLSGQALGGHMRKHRKLSPHDGGEGRRSPEVADDAGRGQEKTAVAASPGKSHGDGKKTLSAAACHQDVDSSGDDSNSNEEEMFIGNAKHGDADGTERKVAVGRFQELATGAIGNANSAVRKTQYRCELCGKEYLSGQALGGHMRKHRKLSPDHDGGKERGSPEAEGIPNQRAVVVTGNSRLSETRNSQYGTPFDASMIGWL